MASGVDPGGAYTLRPPATREEWERFRHIRRTVVLDTRGECEGDATEVADTSAAGDYPLLLFHDGEGIGVIRIEVRGPLALFRHAAVRPASDRSAHEGVLLALAEEFTRSKGCTRILTHVPVGSVPLYEDCGFSRSAAPGGAALTDVMQKTVGP